MPASVKGDGERLAYNLRRLDNLLNKDIDSVIIDVFGFSRGAALARAFVNIVNEKRFDNSFKRLKACPSLKVRFVGIYDTVGSFSLPGDDKDPYNFHLDTTKARYIYHMTAQDELRKNFDLQSLKRKSGEMLVFPIEETRRWMVEESMPGVHSDVGGGYSSNPEQGNDNNELSRVYLEKMHRVAVRQEVPLHPLALLESIPGQAHPLESRQIPSGQFFHLNGDLRERCEIGSVTPAPERCTTPPGRWSITGWKSMPIAV